MNRYCNNMNMDYGPGPYVMNASHAAAQNMYFRTAVWTGEYAQMTMMNIPVCGEIGWEQHNGTDQIIRIEQGTAIVQFGDCEGSKNCEKQLSMQDVVFVPSGTWHNIVNAGRTPLKVSSIYAPPHHPRGTIHRTKEDAEKAH